MTAQQILQWIIDHWPQISATAGILMYFAMNLAVGFKEKPLPGEARLSFWWRVAGRASIATFKNIYGTWKTPGAKQPREFVLATGIPVKPILDEVTDKLPVAIPVDPEKAPEAPGSAPTSGVVPVPPATPEDALQGKPGPVSG